VQRTCPTCNTRRSASDPPTIGFEDVEIQDPPNDDIEQGIYNKLLPNTLPATTCDTCNAPRAHVDHSSLDGAPYYLRVKVRVFRQRVDHHNNPVFDANYQAIIDKLQHPYRLPSKLSLANIQANHTTPINYKIHSVISHAGEDTSVGHYITSVRGPKRAYLINDSYVFRATETALRSNPQVVPGDTPTPGPNDTDWTNWTIRNEVANVYMVTYVRTSSGKKDLEINLLKV
jgi:hypothetical protein